MTPPISTDAAQDASFRAAVDGGEREAPPHVRLIRFGVVGASGVAVNVIVAWLAFRLVFSPWWGDAPYAQTAASALGIALSILTNFLLNDAWTWGDRRAASGRSAARRCADFYLASSLAALVQLGVFRATIALWSVEEPLVAGFSAAEIEVAVAQLIGIAVATPLNFVLNHVWTFRAR